MRKLTRLSTMLLLSAGFFALPAAADEIEPGTDFTERIVNPTFDTNHNGWTVDATVNTNNQVAEVFNAQFDFYQELTDLPAGTYKLTADGFYRAAGNDSGTAYKAGTEVINTVLYSITTLKEQQTKLHSLYSVENINTAEVTATLLNGYVDNMQGANQAFIAGYYKENTIENIIVGSDGKLTIGIKKLTANVGSSWAIWDNFKLIYTGEAGIGAYYVTIDELYNQLQEMSFEQELTSGTNKEYTDVTAFKNEVGTSSSDQDLLQSLVDSLTHVLDRATLAKASIQNMIDWTSIVSAFNNSTNFDGKTELEEAIDEAADLISPYNANEAIYAAEIEEGIEVLIKAYRKYRFNEPMTNPATGLDVSWAIWYNNFSDDNGNRALDTDVTKYWVIDNTRTDTSTDGYDFRTNTINGKNCWNNWSTKCTAMNVYQEFNDLPSGIYSFSMVTTNNGPEITDQHAYATTLAGTFNSPVTTYTYVNDENPDKVDFNTSSQWDPLAVDKFVVGSDGKLRIGMRSTPNGNSSSGWFCFTDCQLIYYGEDPTAYGPALEGAIETANSLAEDADMLTLARIALEEAITEAKKIDISSATTEEIEAGLIAINAAIDIANEDIAGLATFKAGSYTRAEAIAENSDFIYGQEIADMMVDVITEQTEILYADNTTSEDLPAIEALLANYVSFVDAYQSALEFAEVQSNPETTSLFNEYLLPDQVEAVKADEGNIAKAKTYFTNAMSFAKVYTQATDIAYDEQYDATACAELMDMLTEQLNAVAADYDLFAEAKAAISLKMKEVTLTQSGEEKDVTIWIENPDIEQTNNSLSIAPNGWTCYNEGTNGNFTKANSGDTYFEAWYSTPSTIEFDYNQTLTQVPPGRYRLEVMARNCQSALPNGASVLYAACNDQEYTKPIYSHAIQTGRTETIYDEDGITVVYDPINNDTLDLYVIDNIIATRGTLKIGVKNISEMNTNWFAADEFRLYHLEELEGIEDTQADNANTFSVYVENGYIQSRDGRAFRLITINGISVDSTRKLAPGMYIAIDVQTGETDKIVVQQ